MHPYGGAESPEKNPFSYFSVGTIIDILDENNMPIGKNQANTNAYFSVRIMFFDRGGEAGSFGSQSGVVPLTYTHIGRGHGLLYKVSKGDTVVVGFRQDGYAVIVGFLPNNYYNRVNGVDENGYTFRQLVEDGEYSLKAKQGGEVYLDKEGSIHLITRDTSQTKDITFNNGIENISETIVQDQPQVEVVVGKTFAKKTVGNSSQIDFDNEVLSSKGGSTRLSVQDYETGVKIIVDGAGNIEVTGTTVTINGGGQPMVRGMALFDWLANHTHIGNLGAPTSPPVDPPTPDILSATEEIE